VLDVDFVLGFLLQNLDVGNAAYVSELFRPEDGGSMYLQLDGNIGSRTA
jgi:hypothetical protein